MAVTRGANGWKSGTDVVVEGPATRATGADTLSEPDHPSWVYRVDPTKVLVFAKDPPGQTSFRF